MNIATTSLTASLLAVALLLLLVPALPTGAQGTLSLAFESPYVVVNASANEVRVNYHPNVLVSPADATVECTPGIGKFPRGATKVDCTATLGAQTKRGSFYVLVARGDDTDIALGPITQDPSPVEPNGYVTYNVEYRPIIPTTANIVEISTRLPPQLRFREASGASCNTSRLPALTCRIFNIGEPGAFQIMVQTLPPFQGSYSLSWSLTMVADNAGNLQRDLLASNNSASITTEVRVAQAPHSLYLPLLRR